MKKSACLLALLLGSVGAVRAQVEVEVVMDQEQFLSKESVPLSVRIINNSGQTLRFGTNDWLTYLVESQSGFVVQKLGDPPTAHNFEVVTSKTATQRAELSPYFELSRSGHYLVTASVKLADWDVEINSRPAGFDVISGVTMWEQPFGVPPSSPTNHEPPEVRKYVLQKANYLKHLRLYLRLTDESGSTVFRVLPIGKMTSFSQTQTQLDTKNNLHLLYEEAARTYNYSVITPDGDLIVRQQYVYTDTPARLKMDDAGKVVVAGAQRNVTSEDVPPPRASSTNSVAPVTPVTAPQKGTR